MFFGKKTAIQLILRNTLDRLKMTLPEMTLPENHFCI